MIKIGLLSYSANPIETMPELRMRALLAEAALQGVSLVVIDPSGFDVDKDLVEAAYWTGTAWKYSLQTLPDAVFVFNTPIHAKHLALEKALRGSSILVTDRGVDKLELLSVMAGTGAEHYIPTTQRISKDKPAEMLADFLRQNHAAVVKRASGNQGKGLFFIRPECDEGVYVVRYDKRSFSGTLEQVSNFVAQRIAGRLNYREYLAQRFIPSVAGDGRPSDIRVHMQRQSGGAWGITRAYVRLAEVGMPLANSSKGGYQGPLDGFLKQRKTRPEAEVKAELVKAAFLIAELEDAGRTNPLSELGLDFLIDDSDQIWLIETNTFPQSSLHEHARAVHFIGYTKWLALDGLISSRRKVELATALQI